MPLPPWLLHDVSDGSGVHSTYEAGIKPHDRTGRFHQQISEEQAALFADRAHPLLASGREFATNQTKLAGNVLAPIKAFYVANGQHES